MITMKSQLMEVHELIKEISDDLRKLWELMHYASQCKTESDLPHDIRMFTPDEWDQIAITLAHWHELMKQCNSLQGKPQTEWLEQRGELWGYMRDMVKCWVSRLHEGGKA